MGIAQRHIRVGRTDIPDARIHRKPLPTSIKTFGNLIQVKRYETGFTCLQLALKMGIARATVQAWESDSTRPNEQQMEQLARILKIRTFGG